MNKFDYAELIEYDLLFKWFMCRKGHRKARWKRKWTRFFNR